MCPELFHRTSCGHVYDPVEDKSLLSIKVRASRHNLRRSANYCIHILQRCYRFTNCHNTISLSHFKFLKLACWFWEFNVKIKINAWNPRKIKMRKSKYVAVPRHRKLHTRGLTNIWANDIRAGVYETQMTSLKTGNNIAVARTSAAAIWHEWVALTRLLVNKQTGFLSNGETRFDDVLRSFERCFLSRWILQL